MINTLTESLIFVARCGVALIFCMGAAGVSASSPIAAVVLLLAGAAVIAGLLHSPWSKTSWRELRDAYGIFGVAGVRRLRGAKLYGRLAIVFFALSTVWLVGSFAWLISVRPPVSEIGAEWFDGLGTGAAVLLLPAVVFSLISLVLRFWRTG